MYTNTATTRVRVMRNTHPQSSEPFRGLRILVIAVKAMWAMIFIVIVRIEWAVGGLSCNSLGVVV